MEVPARSRTLPASRPTFGLRFFRPSLVALLALACATAPQAQEPAERNGWRYIVLHHSASPGGNAAKMNRFHRGRGWDGVAYHFVITNGKGGADGGLQVTDRWWQQKHGAHAGSLPAEAFPGEKNGYNEFGIGICLVGNFEKKAPTRAQMVTLTRLVRRLQGLFDIPAENILGHRHVRDTACPGRHFPWRGLFARLALPTPQHLYRQASSLTMDRCPWCHLHPDPTEGPGSVAAQSTPPHSASPDLPPPINLLGR